MADDRHPQNKQSRNKHKYFIRGEIWQHADIKGIYRGGGNNGGNSKLLNPFISNPPNFKRLIRDIKPFQQGNQWKIRPTSGIGISFATSYELLREKELTGRVYALKDKFPLPCGLRFNFTEDDKYREHPLLHVNREMIVFEEKNNGVILGEFIDKLIELDKCLIKTDVAIVNEYDKVTGKKAVRAEPREDGMNVWKG